MADVRPFRGLRYGAAFIPQLHKVLAGPFDVVSPEEQRTLYAQSPFNIVRIELGEARPGDTPSDNRYTRAAALLQSWLRDGTLVHDQQEAFYLSRHTFRKDGREYARWELYAQVRLEEWEKRVVLPHEHTLPGAKEDRLNLLRAVKTNVSPVYGLYPDADGAVTRLLEAQAAGAPLAQVAEWRDTSFQVWAITSAAATRAISDALRDRRLYIADGHHRYETALNYRNERRAAGAGEGDEGHNFVLMALTAVQDPGLLVLPLHRLLRRLPPERLRDLPARLEADWHVERVPAHGRDPAAALQRLAAARPLPCFALYGLEAGMALVIRPRALEALRALLPEGMAPPLKALDLSLLHEVVFHRYLGIGRDGADVERSLGYEHEAAEALRAVDAGAYQLAVLVNATRVEEMVAVADAGEKMPQKSTFFYPKLPTGLVLRPVEACALA